MIQQQAAGDTKQGHIWNLRLQCRNIMMRPITYFGFGRLGLSFVKARNEEAPKARTENNEKKKELNESALICSSPSS